MSDTQGSLDWGECTEAEAFLARVRPLPSDEFVKRTEERLLGRQRAGFRRQKGLAGIGLAAGVGGLIYLLGGFGGGPLSSTQDEVRARDTCRSQTIQANPSAGALEFRDGRVVVVPSTDPSTALASPCP